MENDITNQQELLAKNLAYYRKASGLTQLELADKFNYSDKSVSKWERGEGFPDIFVLKSLADFYGITVDDFYQSEHKAVKVSQNKKRKQIVCEEAVKERNMGRDHEVITLHSQEVYCFFKEITGWS